MKIEHIRSLIAQYFLNLHPIPTLDDAVLANVVLFQCANSAYFNHQSPLVLSQRAPDVVQIGLLHKGHSMDLWDPLEDHYEHDFGEYFPNQIMWPKHEFKTIAYDQLSKSLQAQAQHHCQQLQKNPEIKKLFEPSTFDLAARHTFTIEQCDRNNINERLKEILGSGKDLGLHYSDIRYHKVPSVMNKAHWDFWIAHNQNEIAGVLGGLRMSDDDYAFRLSYVSVSPAFRQQGLAKRLYTQALQYCFDNQLILVRSSPGEMTRDVTEITHGFDKILLSSNVPHLADNALLFEMVVHELKQQYPWDEFVAHVKPVCDTWLEKYAPSTSAWSISPMDKKRVFTQFKSLLSENRAQQLPTPFI